MFKGILVCFNVLFFTLIFGQELHVVDEKNQPLDLVEVKSISKQVRLFTNEFGKVNIDKLKGAEDITISSFSYEQKILSYREIAALNFVVSLETSVFSQKEIVISATRWKRPMKMVPQEIAKITTEQIALQNPQTAADLLGVSGKVFIQKSQQGGGSPMIRGFATNRLLYVVDGVRMNTAIFRSGNVQNVISLDPQAMEGAEVLFGPASTLYGSDAVGGVMSFQTLEPTFSVSEEPFVKGKALMRYSSANNERTGHFDVNIGWKKWAILSSVSHNEFDHLRQGRHGPNDYLKSYHVVRVDSVDQVVEQEDPLLQIPSGYEQLNLMQKVRYSPNPHWNLTYAFHYSETSNYGRYDRHNRIRNGAPRYGTWNYGPQIWMMNHLKVEHEKDNFFYERMSFNVATQNFQESRISRDFNDDMEENRFEEVDAYSFNLDFVRSNGKKNTLFYGAEYVLNDVASSGVNRNVLTGVEVPGPSRYPLSSEWHSAGIYITDEYQFSEDLTLTAGARYNYFELSSQFDNTFYPFNFSEANLNNGALTGSLGIAYRPSKTWVISSNLATAFRSPNVDDVGKVFDSEPGAVVVPNPNLTAEYAYNADISVAKHFGNWLKLDVSGYYTILENALVRRDFQLAGQDSIPYDGELSKVQAIQNAAQATVYGVQFGMELKLSKRILFTTDVNFQRGEEEMDDGSLSPSRHAAPFFGTSRLMYKDGKLSIQFYSQYQGQVTHENLSVSERGKDEIYALDKNGNTFAPAWYTLNFKAIYNIQKHLAISAGVENITDQRYRPYSSGLSGTGRNFILSLQAKF